MRAHELPSFELRPARPLGIFDGHGGSIVSELAAKEFAFRPLHSSRQQTQAWQRRPCMKLFFQIRMRPCVGLARVSDSFSA